MFDSVISTQAAPDMITFLKRKPGQELMFHPPVDDGSDLGAFSHHRPGKSGNDRFDAHPDGADSRPYHKSKSHHAYWKRKQLIIEGHGATFLPENCSNETSPPPSDLH